MLDKMKESKRIKQFFIHFKNWEDYRNGMYKKGLPKNYDQLVNSCRNLLLNQNIFINAMNRVKIEWPISTKVNLTNLFQNRRAWLGQSACCIEYGANIEVTTL